MAWLIDFVGYNSKNSPPLRVSLQVLHILQVGQRGSVGLPCGGQEWLVGARGDCRC